MRAQGHQQTMPNVKTQGSNQIPMTNVQKKRKRLEEISARAVCSLPDFLRKAEGDLGFGILLAVELRHLISGIVSFKRLFIREKIVAKCSGLLDLGV
jgi:hypothetical protein